ncbi:MAG: 30S ribosomal protein S12 methylthiotransferase RimO [Prevotellaceae bacterium]|nr:30S ribosomal protein S12 methylthiotransferase RimO [Candidatus Colivivens equi]
MKKTVDLITLGCSKNLVDSEKVMAMLENAGFQVYHDPQEPQGNIVIINTCGFIQDAKEESINMILEFAQAKDNGKIERLYVMGCLSQRYMAELKIEIPQVDAFFGKFEWNRIIDELTGGDDKDKQLCHQRHITTPKHYAYLKISEGCNRSCAYCAIPIMTGRHKSRTIEDIVGEVEYLVSQGVKEFQVIAQELTYYGMDIYKKRNIAELIRRISDVKGVEWVRLHYAYPSQFPMDLLDVMRERDNVCKYLDIALQHISTKVLKNMRRHTDKEKTYKLIETIRKRVPGIHLRTTLMVGFPGEGKREYEELKEFVKWARFERMGAFAYSEEDGTYAAKTYKDSMTRKKKEERLSELMDIQQGISAEVQAEKVGQTLKVIIDRKEGEYYVGRTEFDSPEVDPEVLIPVNEKRLQVGNFYYVRIVDSDDFDLFGTAERAFS